jgi:hypothetical protein
MQSYNVSIAVNWVRPACGNNRPYHWGAKIPGRRDIIWGQKNLIYRWVRNSSKVVAYVGKSQIPLCDRIKQYIKPGPSQRTNQRVYAEQQRLAPNGDFLYLEYTDLVPGYNLSIKRELLWAESLLISLARPYLQ